MEKNLKTTRALLGFMFFVSGFCALLYQSIWLRLAFAEFGVISPIVSVVVATFMLGLGLGSWVGGRCAIFLKTLLKGSAVIIYGIVEAFIGLGAFLVPKLFHYGAALLDGAGGTNSWIYLLNSALVIAVSILPVAIAMGMTYPIILEFLRERESDKENPRRFGFLYAANTAGACLGAITTIFILVEMLGFKKVLFLGALSNFFIAGIAIVWGIRQKISGQASSSMVDLPRQQKKSNNYSHYLIILFVTGFCSMAMEVVWIRSFTPLLGNSVYAFAFLLSTYLFSNWLGASTYRSNLIRKKVISQNALILSSATAACLPLLASNPLFFGPLWEANLFGLVLSIVLISIMPFSAVLGYLTPLIIDELSLGDPNEAGKAYAINIIGCVVGPLFAGYLILPLVGARFSLILFILPLLLLSLGSLTNGLTGRTIKSFVLISCVAILIGACFWSSWEEEGFLGPDKGSVVTHRDYAATTISMQKNNKKLLLVNGHYMTSISRVTKFMAHMPLVFHGGKSKSVLVICFGMGTTFRSALTWPESKVTVVELVPGVRDAFDYYYSDAKAVRANPNGSIVIDDGRRFLRRTSEKFDVIIVDPPPPLRSSASGLLYSKEFFELAKSHLNPGGILQEWFGFWSETKCMSAMLQSLKQEFPYIRVYRCIKDPNIDGCHFLASNSPIKSLTTQQFDTVLPDEAKNDLLEPLSIDKGKYDLIKSISELLSNEIYIDAMPLEKGKMITDDNPINEYFLLRSIFGKDFYSNP